MVKPEPISEGEIINNDSHNNNNNGALGPFMCPHCSAFFSSEHELVHHHQAWNHMTTAELARRRVINMIRMNHQLHNPQFSTPPPPPQYPFEGVMVMDAAPFHGIFELVPTISAADVEGYNNPYDHHNVRGLTPPPPPPPSPMREFNFHETMDFLSLMEQPVTPTPAPAPAPDPCHSTQLHRSTTLEVGAGHEPLTPAPPVVTLGLELIVPTVPTPTTTISVKKEPVDVNLDLKL